MSAYIVDTRHIDLIVSAAAAWFTPQSDIGCTLYAYAIDGTQDQFNLRDSLDRNRLGQVLLDANYASVNARYNENETAERYHYTPVPGVADVPVGAIMHALSGYSYQACETDDWRTSLACDIIDRIQHAGISTLPGKNLLAFWEFTDDDARTALADASA